MPPLLCLHIASVKASEQSKTIEKKRLSLETRMCPGPREREQHYYLRGIQGRSRGKEMICDDRAHRSELSIIKKGLGAGEASEMRAGGAVVQQTTEPISCLL